MDTCLARRWMSLAGLAGAAAVGAAARAEVLISNYAAAIGNNTFFGSGSSTVYKAAGFAMGTRPYRLDTVKLSMSFGGGGAGIVSIWRGAGVPQTQVAVLNGPPQTGVGDFVFAPSSTLVLEAGTTYWVYVTSVPNPTGTFLWHSTLPETLPTGGPSGAATFVSYMFNGSPSSYFNRLEITGTAVGASCYANCDGSTGVPLLTGNDFTCFLTAFAAGQATANCDGSTASPVLTANDFICFITAFAAGCS